MNIIKDGTGQQKLTMGLLGNHVKPTGRTALWPAYATMQPEMVYSNEKSKRVPDTPGPTIPAVIPRNLVCTHPIFR